MLTVAVLARNYHMLPSQVIDQATTYDIMIDDVYDTWREYQDKGIKKEPPQFSTEQLQDLLQNYKEKKDGR